ncbi:MAG: DMT family transporter [Salaquimonas sp.]|nr:DMT family transporter [Salaquimonas sp.]
MLKQFFQGVPAAFLAYAAFSGSDALIKQAGSGHSSAHAGVFEIGFFVALFSILPVVLFRPAEERWRMIVSTKRPLLVHLRGISGVVGGLLSIYAFTHLPLAEAYALIFLIPVFVTILSVVILHEPVGWRRWLAVFTGFGGVLLVVRPGFREITIAHAAGIGVAFCGALTIILLRTLAGSERRSTLMGIIIVYALVVNFVGMVLSGFTMPLGSLLAAMVGAGVLTGFAHIALVQAASAPANHIAPVQYSQIVWAVVLGALFFAEVPNLLTFAGLAVLALSGLFTFIREETRFGWSRRIPILRNRL